MNVYQRNVARFARVEYRFDKIRVACSRLSVSEDDRKSERATSGISYEWDPGCLEHTNRVI